MRLKNNRSGFTLLEIIIVIIIVGVLASLAMPRLFNTIEYSRSTEALTAIGSIKRAADRCDVAIQATNDTTDNYGNCLTWNQLGIEDPGASAGAVFTYAAAYATPIYTITATRQGGTSAGQTITFTYNTGTGATTRVGTGPYSALK